MNISGKVLNTDIIQPEAEKKSSDDSQSGMYQICRT